MSMFSDAIRAADADDFGKYIIEQLQLNPQDKLMIEKYLVSYYKKMIYWAEGVHSKEIEQKVLNYFEC